MPALAPQDAPSFLDQHHGKRTTCLRARSRSPWALAHARTTWRCLHSPRDKTCCYSAWSPAWPFLIWRQVWSQRSAHHRATPTRALVMGVAIAQVTLSSAPCMKACRRSGWGAFYRLNAQTMTIESLALPGVAIANSICFSPDGTTMYYCDSLQAHIFCCDYPALKICEYFRMSSAGGTGRLLCRCRWLPVECRVGGSRVVRYQPGWPG